MRPSIDFVDTYSAAFRRDRFLEMGGYDTSFPVACAEDMELSYRMSARGWKMMFAPEAMVYHTHPDTFRVTSKRSTNLPSGACWPCARTPKAVKDSHTPQIMKFQLLLAPALMISVAFDLAVRPAVSASRIVLAVFLLSALPFTFRAMGKDLIVGLLSPVLLAARACAQLLGVTAGLIYACRKPIPVATNSPAS